MSQRDGNTAMLTVKMQACFVFPPLLPVPSYAWSSYLALKTIPARGSNSLRFTWYKKCYGVGRDGGGVGCHCKHLNKFLSFLRVALTYAEVHPLYQQPPTPIYILLKKRLKKEKVCNMVFLRPVHHHHGHIRVKKERTKRERTINSL